MKEFLTKRSNLFIPVMYFKMERSNLNFWVKIHSSKDPSIEFITNSLFYSGEKNKIKLLFPSDMIRKKFVENLCNWYYGNN